MNCVEATVGAAEIRWSLGKMGQQPLLFDASTCGPGSEYKSKSCVLAKTLMRYACVSKLCLFVVHGEDIIKNEADFFAVNSLAI